MAKKQTIELEVTPVVTEEVVLASEIISAEDFVVPAEVPEIKEVIETTYLKAVLTPGVTIQSDSDIEKDAHVAAGITRIVVFPKETIYIPVSDIPVSDEYELEIFKRIDSLYELVSRKLVNGCVVIKSISDTPRAIVSESIIAIIKVRK